MIHPEGLRAPSGRSPHHLPSSSAQDFRLSDPGEVGFGFSLRKTPRSEIGRDSACVIHFFLYTVLYSFYFSAVGCLWLAEIASVAPVLTPQSCTLKQVWPFGHGFSCLHFGSPEGRFRGSLSCWVGRAGRRPRGVLRVLSACVAVRLQVLPPGCPGCRARQQSTPWTVPPSKVLGQISRN